MGMDNKMPEIRFEEFGGNWSQQKLDTIFGKIRNAFVGTATPYYVNEGHFYLESNNVKDGKINRKNEIFINDEFYYKQSDKWLREGDIVMVQSGHVGHTAVIPPELNNIAAHALIMFTDPKEEVNSHFLNFQFQTDKIKKNLAEITTGNTIKHILSSEMKEFEMFFSDYEEQAQIGNYFQKLDELINQHQQKHDKLSNIKKALLEKMFPKQGKIIPEIRFKGFSREWKETILSEFTDKYDNLRVAVTAKDRISGNTPYYGANGIQGYVEGYTHNGEYVLLAEDGANDINNYPIHYVNGKIWVNNHAHVLKAKKNSSSIFLKYALNNIDFEPFLVGGGRAKLNASIMMNLVLSIPTDIKEQIKIGNYFQKLDTLINQHQQQITKLKNIKQACLIKMFV